MKLIASLAIIMLVAFIGSTRVSAQSLPVGTPVLEDYYRRAQLMGQVDSTVSFTIRPLYPVQTLKIGNYMNPSYQKEQSIDSHSFWRKFTKFQLLPITWNQNFTTKYPYSLNDGAMIPARGYQTLVSGGFYAKLGPLNVQLQPEVVFAENKPFATFLSLHSGNEIHFYYGLKDIIDLPEYFPGRPYKRFYPGQSSVRLSIGPLSGGISSENLWWGPGIYNSLLMTNSSAGFLHLTLNTVRPIKTLIGSFEGQLIGGHLDPSGFFGADTSQYIYAYKLYHKRNDWRYLNGVILTYNPHWTPGIFLGVTRSFIGYNEDLGDNIKNYFPVFTPMEKKNNYGEGESTIIQDQRASVFIRWLLPKDHAELYFEYGREDHSYDLRDFLIQPDYTRSYILGLQKVFPLDKIKGTYFKWNFELTQIETNLTSKRAPAYVWYTHLAGIYHGYTNEGQPIGAGIGPGSDLQTTTLTWGRGLKTLGIQIERYVHNNDFFHMAIQDIRAHWVDINLTALGEYDYKNFLFFAKLQIIRSLNYEYNYRPVTSGLNQFWVPGLDRYNFQTQINVSYRF